MSKFVIRVSSTSVTFGRLKNLILLASLANVSIRSESNDKIIWPLKPNASFSVKCFGNRLANDSNCPSFPPKAVPKSKAPMKACFLTWWHLRRIPTEDMLKIRNFNSTSRCAMCVEEKSVNHHIIHCCWFSSLCHLSLSMMRASYIQPSIVQDVLGKEKKIEEGLGSLHFEVASLSY